ncbi:hypothetical protein KY290_015292 [Solanum tuberosum]|uniref:Uncharacterized protein n=1 Tax=Solanum tuberosum TaxID=4113 RepID=A0ABQ7VS22_SOLTU|nr:hypothetical protein KY290_015292 [Solanum tuberosum]
MIWFVAPSESSRKAAGNNNIKTGHDVPLMPETRAVWRLHHSAEAICSELPQLSSHQCDPYTSARTIISKIVVKVRLRKAIGKQIAANMPTPAKVRTCSYYSS